MNIRFNIDDPKFRMSVKGELYLLVIVPSLSTDHRSSSPLADLTDSVIFLNEQSFPEHFSMKSFQTYKYQIE